MWSGLLGGMSWELGLASLGAMVAVVAAAAGIRSMLGSRTSEVARRLERTVGRSDLVERVAGRSRSGLGRVLQPLSWVVRPTKAAELSLSPW